MTYLLFLRDSDSLLAVERIFAGYAVLSGAQFSREKSKALKFGLFSVEPISFPFVSTLRVLVVPFLRSGLAPLAWKDILDQARI